MSLVDNGLGPGPFLHLHLLSQSDYYPYDFLEGAVSGLSLVLQHKLVELGSLGVLGNST